MSGIPDFSDSELWLVRNALEGRNGNDISVELTDDEFLFGSAGRKLTDASTLISCVSRDLTSPRSSEAREPASALHGTGGSDAR